MILIPTNTVSSYWTCGQLKRTPFYLFHIICHQANSWKINFAEY